MGFRAPRKTYKLTFADPDYGGLEVRCHAGSVGDALRVAELQSGDIGAAEAREVLAVFATALIDWNVEDEQGEPVPTTVDGLYLLDQDFLQSIIAAWSAATQAVPAPLEPTSNGGPPSVEPSIPMETLSPNP